MKYLLINNFKFPESSFLMLTEEETDPYRQPTKYNMRMVLFWLVQGCKPGDSLVFHFSGHGSQQRNSSQDEVDGFDETLCPIDYETQGMIVDDEINATIVRPLPRGVKLHAIIDACHSRSALDLPFLSRTDKEICHCPRPGKYKGTNTGGAMTYSFIRAIELGHGATYGTMLNSVRSTLGNADNPLDGGILTLLLTLLTGGSSGGGVRQEPQPTCQ